MKKDKLFYVALALGIVALCSALVVYNRKTMTTIGDTMDLSLLSDLTKMEEPKDEIAPPVIDTESVFDASDSKKIYPEHKETKDEISKEHKESSSETSKTSTEASTEVGAEVSTEDALTPVPDYHGEQSLLWPVEGNIIKPFSMDTTIYFETMDQYQCNPGMLVEASEGEVVHAPEEAIVTKIIDDKRYGTMVTLDFGNGYVMKIGQLKDVIVSEGDYVMKGTQIGVVSTPTAFFEKEGTHLYLQMECNEEPLDPTTVLK